MGGELAPPRELFRSFVYIRYVQPLSLSLPAFFSLPLLSTLCFLSASSVFLSGARGFVHVTNKTPPHLSSKTTQQRGSREEAVRCPLIGRSPASPSPAPIKAHPTTSSLPFLGTLFLSVGMGILYIWAVRRRHRPRNGLLQGESILCLSVYLSVCLSVCP